MRAIVVGAGNVGYNIAKGLADDREVAVVDKDKERAESITYDIDVLSIHGDGIELETLEEAGIRDDDVELLIACTDDDLANAVICGTAKTVSDVFTIARVKGSTLLDTWERTERAFGVDFMVSSDLKTAQTIVQIAGLPGAQDVDTFANGLIHMAEFTIEADSPIAGKTIAESDIYEALTFAAVIRPEEVVIPTGDTVINAEDNLVVIGSPQAVRSFASDLSPDPTLEDADEIVIVGGSKVGYHTARLLEEQGHTPRLVEYDHDRARELAELLPETVVLESDATDVDFLVREHVDESDIVVAALDSDEKNLLVSLLAKRIGVNRTVGVVELADYVDLFETVGIDVAVNPRFVTAEEIIQFTRGEATENVAILESDRAEVLEIEVNRDSVLFGNELEAAMADLPAGVVIGAIARNGALITPRGDTVIEPGDHVVVFVDTKHIDEVLDAL